jgi:hypothetical protein
MNNYIVPYDPLFAATQQPVQSPRFESYTLHTPLGVKIDSAVRIGHWFLRPFVRLLGFRNGPTVLGRWTRFQNSVSCAGCCHLIISRGYNSAYCNHPFYREIYGSHQSIGGFRVNADSCPVAMGERGRRIKRVRENWNRIFWGYYYDTNRNPYTQGFRSRP